jgi:hypothetical protein
VIRLWKIALNFFAHQVLNKPTYLPDILALLFAFPVSTEIREPKAGGLLRGSHGDQYIRVFPLFADKSFDQ